MYELKKKFFCDIFSIPEEMVVSSPLLEDTELVNELAIKMGKKYSIDPKYVFMMIIFVAFTSTTATRSKDFEFLVEVWLLSYMLIKQSEGSKHFEMDLIENQIIKKLQNKNISDYAWKIWNDHKSSIKRRLSEETGDSYSNHGSLIFYAISIDLKLIPNRACQSCEDALTLMWNSSNEIMSADGEMMMGESIKRDSAMDYETLKSEVLRSTELIMACDEDISFKQHVFSGMFSQFLLSKYTLDYYMDARLKRTLKENGLDYF